HYTPYRLSTRSIDVFDNSIADNRSLMGMTTVGFTHAYAATDILLYASPDYNGFNFSAAYVGKNDNSLPATTNNTATPPILTDVANLTSISANYGMDGWSATLSNQTVTAEDKVTAANESELSATKLAGTYAMDAFTVGLVYEMVSDTTGTTSVKAERDNVYLAGTYMLSDTCTIKLAYTQAGEAKVGGTEVKNSGATQVSLGYDHAMTENTTLFALYTSISNDAAAMYGLNSGSSTGDTGAVAADDDPSAIAFGIRHSF
ncbi:MAG: porin, partial [Gallionella sp.]